MLINLSFYSGKTIDLSLRRDHRMRVTAQASSGSLEIRVETDTLFISHPVGKGMKGNQYGILLVIVFLVAILTAGCTTTTTIGNPSQGQATPAPTAMPAASAQATSAPVVAATTPACPDANEKGVWDYGWDTRWKGYASNHDIRDITNGKAGEPDSWDGINSPPPTNVKMNQKCRDVTGTIAFSTDPVCTGILTGTIEKDQLTGVWKTTGCQPEEEGAEGTFSITMAADNKSWMGKLISSNDPYKNHDDNPPNWAGRRV